MEQSTSAEPVIESTTLSTRRHWLGLPVNPPVKGTIDSVTKSLPHFGRQPFSMTSVNGNELGVNPYLDMVYRMPSIQGENCIPIGIVSKNYRLIDHHHLLRTVQEAFAENGVDTANISVEGEWTVNGERAHFSFLLPPEDSYRVQISENDEMRFRIELFNSVEGSCRLMAVAGWHRFVCLNGLILGTALMHLREQHRQQLQIEELGRLLREVIQITQTDKDTLQKWLSATLEKEAFRCWIDQDVRKLWGFKAAVRVLGISLHGHDVKPVGDLKNLMPTQVATRRLDMVPGVEAPVKHMFGLSQVLSWVAGQRREISEDLERRSQVPELMQKLTGLSNRRATTSVG